MEKVNKLANELQAYTKIIGIRNKHIQSVANNLVELTEQTKLNPNQRIVLTWLKTYMLDDSDFFNTIYALNQLRSNGVPYKQESKAFTELNNKDLAQVIEIFSKWAQTQEEK